MKRMVQVTTIVEVEVNETLFTEQWLTEWRRHFYNFLTIEDHIKHLAQMQARSILFSTFTEGYGRLADMGISATVIDQTEEIIEHEYN